jgi:hypothetical protein
MSESNPSDMHERFLRAARAAIAAQYLSESTTSLKKHSHLQWINIATSFEGHCYRLPASITASATGPILELFEFYSQLYSPEKQLSTQLSKLSLAQVAQANSTMSYGELTHLLQGN